MEYLHCYTVKANVVEGIQVDEFDSIVVEPATTQLKKAVLQIVPILRPENDKSLNSVSESSLSFLKEVGKKDTESKDYVVIAVDPAEWKLCYQKDSFGLIDPCGVNGMVLLLVKKGTKHVLVKADDKHMELSINDNNKPVISKCSRASLLFDTVTTNIIKREISKLPTQFLLTAPKAAAKPARS